MNCNVQKMGEAAMPIARLMQSPTTEEHWRGC